MNRHFAQLEAEVARIRALLVEPRQETLDEAARALRGLQAELTALCVADSELTREDVEGLRREVQLAAAAAGAGIRLTSGYLQAMVGSAIPYNRAEAWDGHLELTRPRAEG